MPGLNLAFLPGQKLADSVVSQELPPGGATDEVLAKASPADGDVRWNPPGVAPPANQLVPIASGNPGDVLHKIDAVTTTFAPLPVGIPTGGTPGQVLVNIAPGIAGWGAVPGLPAANQLVPPGGATDDVLGKTSGANNAVSWRPVALPPLSEEVQTELDVPSQQEFDELKAKVEELTQKLATLTATTSVPKRRSS